MMLIEGIYWLRLIANQTRQDFGLGCRILVSPGVTGVLKS